MKINNDSSWLNAEQIATVEKMKQAKYICETPIKDTGGSWVNIPCAIFYNSEPHPQGSNYFALYKLPLNGKMYIANGISALEGDIVGAVSDDGEVIYSRYRHDYRTSSDGSVTIDGGRDYVRTTTSNLVKLKVIGDELKVIANELSTQDSN